MSQLSLRPSARPGRLAAVLALVVALVVGLTTLVAPGRADAATTHVSLKGASSTYGDVTTTLTVTWKVGSSGHRGTVTLQRRSGSTWKKVATAKTSSKGVVKIKVRPATTTTYRVRTSTGKVSAAKKLTVHAAYTLTGSAGKTIMAGTSAKLTATYRHHGKAVSSATIALERRSGSTWVRVTTLKISKGTGSVTVSPGTTTTYRFRKPGVVASSSHTVTVKPPPSSFTITGSGDGHGLGMSQYGAYAMALAGRSAAQILAAYYPRTTLDTTTYPARRIAVQVFGPGSDTATSTTVTIAPTTAGEMPEWQLVDVSSATEEVVASGSGTVTMTLGVASDKPTVTVAGTTHTATAAFDVRWSGTSVAGAPPSGADAYASVAGAHGTYRDGQLVVTAIAGKTQPNVVNDVLLNTEYLYGLDEMPSSWGWASSGKGMQALEAQAIVARTYALIPALEPLRASCDCNVYDDTRSQNYTGWSKEGGTGGDTWKAAVDATTTATTDQVLTYGGHTSYAQTPYFAASGGRTGANQDVFGGTTSFAYLQGVADPWTAQAPGIPASYTAWTDTVSQATVAKIFGLSTVKTITVTARYASGQVETLTATSDTGKKVEVTRTAEGWRTGLGLKADWFTSLTPHA